MMRSHPMFAARWCWLVLTCAMSAAVLFGQVGCAVATIDVDVYVGPMANEREVQLQQMAVMAQGAKPILAQLFADLEGGDIDDYDCLKLEREKLTSTGAQIYAVYSLYLDQRFEQATQDKILELAFEFKSLPRDVELSKDQRDTADRVVRDLALLAIQLQQPEDESVPLPSWSTNLAAALPDVCGADQLISEQSVYRVADLTTIGVKKISPSGAKEVDEVIAKMSAAAACALNSGRPKDGLDKICRQYAESLRTYYSTKEGSQARDKAERDLDGKEEFLLVSLIHFAERVRMLANMPERQTVNWLTLVWGLKLRPERDVLQVIGNSILASVNEIRAQENHDARMEQQTPMRTAVHRGASLSSPSVAFVPAAKRPEDVIDMLIAMKQNEMLNHDLDGDAAKRTLARIKYLEEIRSGMAYIRPPGFYLRSSSPVSNFSSSSARGPWRNLIWEHGKRSIPPFNIVPALMNGDNYFNAAQQEEIDGHSWHNINRVRVAGAGRTNYVLIKDDIGNWSIKNYRANSESVIGAAGAAARMAAVASGTPTFGSQTAPPAPTPTPSSERALYPYDSEYRISHTRLWRQADVLAQRFGNGTSAKFGEISLTDEEKKEVVALAITADGGKLGSLESESNGPSDAELRRLDARLSALALYHQWWKDRIAREMEAAKKPPATADLKSRLGDPLQGIVKERERLLIGHIADINVLLRMSQSATTAN